MGTVTTIAPGLGVSLTELLKVIGRTTDAMIAVDIEFRVIAWNEAATALLGHTATDVLGRPCHEVMCWLDRCANTICDENCPSASLGETDGLIETREVVGRSADGRKMWLSASSIVPPLELRSQCRLIHLVREVALPPELERLISERMGRWQPDSHPPTTRLDVLTPREREVLHLLSGGLNGTAIAEKLFVSPATVRNHIQHILNKLGVHNRVEAVALALREE